MSWIVTLALILIVFPVQGTEEEPSHAWEKWGRVGGESPGPLSGATMVAFEGNLVMFGGLTRTGGASNTIYVLDSSGQPTWNVWTPHAGEPPSPRYGHCAAVVHNDTEDWMVVFGGYSTDEAAIVRDVYAFNLRTYVWMEWPVTNPRRNPLFGMACVYREGYFYAFGGAKDMEGRPAYEHDPYGGTEYVRFSPVDLCWEGMSLGGGGRMPPADAFGMGSALIAESLWVTFGGGYRSITAYGSRTIYHGDLCVAVDWNGGWPSPSGFVCQNLFSPDTYPRPERIFPAMIATDRSFGSCKGLTWDDGECYLIMYGGVTGNDGDEPLGDLWVYNFRTNEFTQWNTTGGDAMPPRAQAAVGQTPDGHFIVTGGGRGLLGKPDDIVSEDVWAVQLADLVDPLQSTIECGEAQEAGSPVTCRILAKDSRYRPTGSPVYAGRFLVVVTMGEQEVKPVVMYVGGSAREFSFLFQATTEANTTALVAASFDHVPLKNSPVTVDLRPAMVDPSHCVASCPRDQILEGLSMVCTIEGRDRYGNPSGLADEAPKFLVSTRAPCKELHTINVGFDSFSTFSFTLVGAPLGYLEVRATYNQLPVGNTPFGVRVVSSGCPVFEQAGENETCVCNPGYFREGDGCRPCDVGFGKTEPGDHPCICSAGFYNRSLVQSELSCVQSYIAYDHGQSYGHIVLPKECQQCPPCVDCEEPQRDSIPPPIEGYWLGTLGSSQVYACPVKESCVGKGQRKCRSGYTGPMCAVCDTGYAGSGLVCTQCGDEIVGWIFTVAVLLVALAILCYFVWTSKEFRSPRSIMMKILLNYLQTMALSGGFQTHVSSAMHALNMVVGISSSSSEAISYSCVLPRLDHNQRLLLYLILLIVAAVLPGVVLWAIQKIRPVLRTGSDLVNYEELKWTGLWDVYRTGRWVLVFLLYPLISVMILETLQPCESIDGVSYMTADRTVECSGAEFTAYLVLAWLFFIVFVLGVPVLVFYMLRARKNDLDDPHVIKRLSFLYSGYHKGMYGWEFIIMARKLGIAMLVAFSVSHPVLQSNLGVLWLAGALVIQLYFQPFEMLLLNRLEEGSLTVCATNVLLAQFYNPQLSTSAGRILLTVILFMLNSSFVIVMAHFLWRTVAADMVKLKDKVRNWRGMQEEVQVAPMVEEGEEEKQRNPAMVSLLHSNEK